MTRRTTGNGTEHGGFTLMEVVLALVVLEAAVLGAFGTLLLGARATRDAEREERAVADAEGILDSLSTVAEPTSGTRPSGPHTVRWDVGADGAATVSVVTSTDSLLFEARTRLER